MEKKEQEEGGDEEVKVRMMTKQSSSVAHRKYIAHNQFHLQHFRTSCLSVSVSVLIAFVSAICIDTFYLVWIFERIALAVVMIFKCPNCPYVEPDEKGAETKIMYIQRVNKLNEFFISAFYPVCDFVIGFLQQFSIDFVGRLNRLSHRNECCVAFSVGFWWYVTSI